MNLKQAFVYSLFLLVSLKSCQSQTAAVTLMPVAQQQFFDQNGNPLAFGCVFTYQSGTSNNLATFSDFTGTIQNANPVALSATGSANIWLQTGQAYTIAVKSNGGTNCSLGTLMYSVDGIIGGTSTTSTIIPSGPTPSFVVVGNIQLFTLKLTQNTVALPVSFVNVQAPAIFTIQLTEDNTGGWTFAWPGNVIGGATIDTAANHTTTETFVWNGTSILPVGSGFNSDGNTLVPGSVVSANTYTRTNIFSAVQTFNAGIAVTGGATIDSTITPLLGPTTQGTAIVASTAPTTGATNSGNFTIQSGNATGSGSAGSVFINGGNASGVGGGGGIVLNPGSSASGQPGVTQAFTKFDAFRLDVGIGGSLSSGNFVLSGWGAGATIGSILGHDQAFSFTVTAGTGPSANPTVQFTYVDGTFVQNPICVVSTFGPQSPSPWITTASSATVLTLALLGTPTAAQTYTANVICLGRN